MFGRWSKRQYLICVTVVNAEFQHFMCNSNMEEQFSLPENVHCLGNVPKKWKVVLDAKIIWIFPHSYSCNVSALHLTCTCLYYVNVYQCGLLSDSWILEIPAPREFYCDTQVKSLIMLFTVDSYHVCHRKGMLTVTVKFLL